MLTAATAWSETTKELCGQVDEICSRQKETLCSLLTLNHYSIPCKHTTHTLWCTFSLIGPLKRGFRAAKIKDHPFWKRLFQDLVSPKKRRWNKPATVNKPAAIHIVFIAPCEFYSENRVGVGGVIPAHTASSPAPFCPSTANLSSPHNLHTTRALRVCGGTGVGAISIAVYLLKMDGRTDWAGSGDVAKREPVFPSQLFAQVDLIWWWTGGIRAGHHRSFLSCLAWEASACQRD